MTPFQLDASAHAPCSRTIVGLGWAELFVLALAGTDNVTKGRTPTVTVMVAMTAVVVFLAAPDRRCSFVIPSVEDPGMTKLGPV